MITLFVQTVADTSSLHHLSTRPFQFILKTWEGEAGRGGGEELGCFYLSHLHITRDIDASYIVIVVDRLYS